MVRMNAGDFPRVVSGLMGVLGLLILIGSFRRDGPPMTPVAVRPVVIIPASCTPLWLWDSTCRLCAHGLAGRAARQLRNAAGTHRRSTHRVSSADISGDRHLHLGNWSSHPDVAGVLTWMSRRISDSGWHRGAADNLLFAFQGR